MAPNVVLTAAHCMGQTLSAFYLGQGVPITIFDERTKALKSMRRFAVREVMVFPSFEVARAFRPDGSIDSGYASRSRDHRRGVGAPRQTRDRRRRCRSATRRAWARPARSSATARTKIRLATSRPPTSGGWPIGAFARRRPYRLFSDSLDGATHKATSGGGLF
ncbi:MAG: hypothetical protein IPG50_11950 [Myxococcales bacterium]|nr:hypothetical protein [Myxococcales bacterium]